MIWKTRRHTLDLTHRGMVMGILNVTPDSFSDGGAHSGLIPALAHARRMIGEGAEIIDIGGESTRPGAIPVRAAEELARTIPIVAALRAEWTGLISIDTMKAEVAEAALMAGADIVNDVSGLEADAAMAGVCAAGRCGVIVMHMRGNPRTMQEEPRYKNVVEEVGWFFKKKLGELVAAGILPEAICFDPGIGFGKTLEHNLALLGDLRRLIVPGRPLLLGISRKSFIGKLLESQEAGQQEWPTAALTSYARGEGVMIHRVHSVKANVGSLRMTEAVLAARSRHGAANA